MASRTIISDFEPDGLFEKIILPPVFRSRIRETRFKQEWKMPAWKYRILRMGWNGEGDPLKWLFQYMRGFKGPKFQRGNFAMFPVGITAVGDVGNVFLTNHGVTHTNGGGIARSGVEFTTDGGLDESEALVNVGLITSGEWHTNEPSATGSNYEVRARALGKVGSWAVSAAADDTWIQISTDRGWSNVRVAKSSPGTTTTSATFELGDNGASSADDSATLTCNAVN